MVSCGENLPQASLGLSFLCEVLQSHSVESSLLCFFQKGLEVGVRLILLLRHELDSEQQAQVLHESALPHLFGLHKLGLQIKLFREIHFELQNVLHGGVAIAGNLAPERLFGVELATVGRLVGIGQEVGRLRNPNVECDVRIGLEALLDQSETALLSRVAAGMSTGLHHLTCQLLQPSACGAVIVDRHVDAVAIAEWGRNEEQSVYEVYLGRRQHTHLEMNRDVDEDVGHFGANALPIALVRGFDMRTVEALLLHLLPEPLRPIHVRESPVVLAVYVAVVVTVEKADISFLGVVAGRRVPFRSVL